MPVIHARTKRWGNSLGVIIPSHAVNELNLKEDQDVEFLMIPRQKAGQLLKNLPSIKLKASTQTLKDEAKKALW